MPLRGGGGRGAVEGAGPRRIEAARFCQSFCQTTARCYRARIYRAARAIVGLDRTVSVQELEWLARLRGELDLDEQTLARIEHPR